MSESGNASANRRTRVALVAGEASGDQLGAHLMSALAAAVPEIRFEGIGGPRMQAAGLDVWHPSEALSVRGYVEVLRHLPRIVGIRNDLRRRLLADPPDLFVGVDAPDFNLGLEEQLRRRGVRTVQYVSPQIWAWRGERVHKLKRAADLVMCLFPFEVPLLEAAGVPVAYVGHPLADQFPEIPNRDAAREQFRLGANQTVVALLPGSRQSELDYMADLFVQSAKLVHRAVRNAHFLVPLQSRQTRTMFEEALYRNDAQELPLTILFGHAHMAMTAADGVLLASGTATLEAALLKRTMVVTYRLSPMTVAAIRRRGASLPYVSLPNILAGRFVVPEILQDEATPANLSQALLNQIGDKVVRARQEQAFLEIHRQLRQNSGERLAAALLPLLGQGSRRAPSASATARSAVGV
jgi:lipid-A-disaccharide synthase